MSIETAVERLAAAMESVALSISRALDHGERDPRQKESPAAPPKVKAKDKDKAPPKAKAASGKSGSRPSSKSTGPPSAKAKASAKAQAKAKSQAKAGARKGKSTTVGNTDKKKSDFTQTDVRKALQELQLATSAAKSKSILKAAGASNLTQLDESKYALVVEQAREAMPS
jgi:hypothetical protein